MSGVDDTSVDRWLAEKDNSHSGGNSSNDSETELSTWNFSKLKISPKPLHTRPSRSQTREQQKAELANQSSQRSNNNTQHAAKLSPRTTSLNGMSNMFVASIELLLPLRLVCIAAGQWD